jgi:hypothetical protein
LGNLAGTLSLGQTAPYGWLVVERAVLLAAGSGERPLRAVALIFGIATVAAAVWVGQRWFSRIGAILLVLMCWIGTLLSQYRFETKHYTADIFFALLLVYLGFRDVTDGFAELLLPALGQRRRCQGLLGVRRRQPRVVIDLEPTGVDSVIGKPWLKAAGAAKVRRGDGCVGVRPMQRW